MSILKKREEIAMDNVETKALKNTNILIVDDNPDDSLIIKEIIEENMHSNNPQITVEIQGHTDNTGTVAANFDQAIEACYGKDYDLCLLDYKLGKRDGIRVLKDFREHGFIMPVIFLTGQGNEEVAVEAMQSGASNYFSKRNIDALKFIKAIRHAIHESKMLNNVSEWLFD